MEPHSVHQSKEGAKTNADARANSVQQPDTGDQGGARSQKEESKLLGGGPVDEVGEMLRRTMSSTSSMVGSTLGSSMVGSALASGVVGSALGSGMVGSTLGRGFGSSLGWSLSSSLGGGFGSSLGWSLGSSWR